MRSSHVHPSRCAADFLGIPEKASVTAFKGMQFMGGLTLGTRASMWECLASKVSFARNLAATAGSVSMPYEKEGLQARPSAPSPARIAALAVSENVVVEAETEAAFVCFAIRLVWASWASLSSIAILPSLSRLHLLESAAGAKLP